MKKNLKNLSEIDMNKLLEKKMKELDDMHLLVSLSDRFLYPSNLIESILEEINSRSRDDKILEVHNIKKMSYALTK